MASSDFSPIRTGSFRKLLAAGAKHADEAMILELAQKRELGVTQLATKPLVDALELEKKEKSQLQDELEKERAFLRAAQDAERDVASKMTEVEEKLREKERRASSLEKHLEAAEAQAALVERDLAIYAEGLSLSIAEAKALLDEVLAFHKENFQLRKTLEQEDDELSTPEAYSELTKQVLKLTSTGSDELFAMYPALLKYRSKK